MSEDLDQRRARQERIAHAAVKSLLLLSEQFEHLTEHAFAGSISYDPWKGSQVMALSFTTKQLEHLKSVKLLTNSSAHRDSLLIARTMVEGLAALEWAFTRKPERTDLWFWYAAIRDWRQTQKNIRNGIAVDSNQLARLKCLVDKHGPRYYKASVAKGIGGAGYQIPADPWRNSWTDVTVETMLDEVGGDAMYEYFYRIPSSWIHWDPQSLLRAAVQANGYTPGFTETDWPSAAYALNSACRAVGQALVILNHEFGLGFAQELIELECQLSTIQKESLEASDLE